MHAVLAPAERPVPDPLATSGQGHSMSTKLPLIDHQIIPNLRQNYHATHHATEQGLGDIDFWHPIPDIPLACVRSLAVFRIVRPTSAVLGVTGYQISTVDFSLGSPLFHK